VSPAAPLTASAVLIAVAWGFGFVQGQPNGRRTMRERGSLAALFLGHAKAMEPDHGGRMAEGTGDDDVNRAPAYTAYSARRHRLRGSRPPRSLRAS
jgi:hypothetical protein